MAGESVSRLRDVSADAVAEEDYQSFCEALGSSARGRAFLQEYARRNRHSDTEAVLAALRRLEETALKQAASSEADRIRQDLRALLDTLRVARPQTENSPTAIKAATFAALIDFAQARIESVVGISEGPREPEVLAAVPVPEQPELPIPHPAATPAPIMALVHAPPRAAERPNVVPATAAVVAPLAKVRELTGIPIVEFDYRTQQAARPVQPRHEPEEAWTALAPPSIAVPPAPAIPVPVEAAPAPEIAMPPVATPEPETYELWLDEPAAAVEETPVVAPPVAEFAPVAIEPVLEAPLAMAATSEVIASESIASESIAADPETPEVRAPLTAGMAMTAIEALVQQMEKSAAPAAVKGKADIADPFAPIMALSDEERIALFT